MTNAFVAPTRSSSAELAGTVSLVTGAARGLGSVLVAELVDAGSQVVLAARDVERAREVAARVDPAGHQTVAVRCDVTDPGSTQSAVDEALASFGRLDTLVCNSGIAGPTRPLWETSPPQWRETIEVNLVGTFLTCRAGLPLLIRQGAGSVIVIGSMTGKRALPDRSSYMASKTGLIGLVRSIASDCGPYGVRANLVSPGAIEGERIDAVFAAQANSRGVSTEDARAELVDSAPLRRLVTNDDVARVVRFLAGNAAAGITGEDVNVSAGLVMY